VPGWLQPSAAAAAALSTAGTPGSPIVCDSSALAARAGRRGIVLPESPRTLRRIRRSRAGASLGVLALGEGRKSSWLESAASSWDSLLDRSQILFEEEAGTIIYQLPPAEEERAAGPPSMRVDRFHTLPLDYAPDELVEIESPPASRAGIRVTAQTRSALEKMFRAARDDGIELRVISGYRSSEYQSQLFARAVERYGDDQAWVAVPGQSEHQLGTTVDLADAALKHSLEQSFGETAEGQWLRENCNRFGFTLSYTVDNQEETGIHPEPWHVRYWGAP
jgi:LAS superfamily LD-carboxypeptidase LdcB